MKKLLVILLSLALVCGVFAGCNGEGATSSGAGAVSIAESATFDLCDEKMRPLVTTEHVYSVENTGYNEENKCYTLVLLFTVEGKEKLAQATKANIGKQLYAFVNGSPTLTALIMEEITDGRLVLVFHNEHEATAAYNGLVNGK